MQYNLILASIGNFVETHKVYRILDANLNRSREALRVLEDFVRFNISNKALTAKLKTLRHRLSRFFIAQEKKLLSFRDAIQDVGKDLDKGNKRTRSLKDVITANFKRLEESLRSIEECSRTFDVSLSNNTRHLRFDAYTLEKEILLSFMKAEKLRLAQLYVLLDPNVTSDALPDVAKKSIDGGADILQLRAKELNDHSLFALATKIKAISSQSGRLFIINDRVDIAQAVDADGVHLGKDDLPIRVARKILGDDKIVGGTSHSLNEANYLAKEGADYISVGPMFPSNTKPNIKPFGFSYLKQALKEIEIPVFAIGGITSENVEKITNAACQRVAVCAGVILQDDIKLAAEKIKARIPKPAKMGLIEKNSRVISRH